MTAQQEAQTIKVGQTILTAAGNWVEVTRITHYSDGMVLMSLKDHCPCHWHKTEMVSIA